MKLKLGLLKNLTLFLTYLIFFLFLTRSFDSLLRVSYEYRNARTRCPSNDTWKEHSATRQPFSARQEAMSTPYCGRISTRSKWFCERYSETVKAFWSRDDPPISKESMNAIRDTRIDYVFTEFKLRQITAMVFKRILSNDIFGRWRSQKNGSLSCAVVGNSDNLLGSNYGSIIDSHDVVIRMNAALTEGYEKDVGAKTTFQSLYSQIKFAGLAPSIIDVHPCEVYLIHPDFYRSLMETWLRPTSGQKLSSGIILQLFAVHVCNKVDVFGFGVNKKGEYKHYFYSKADKNLNESHSYHDFQSEAELRQKLADEGIITVYPGAVSN
ncbi:CMP-N-acetylneuraminate-beta-galactosamide-alpha-2,3-sialyltransferase 1-like isoform X2 [Oscarella lobularis]|uniref:CMP-N-acetylneuraminate-beta-galactosamide- alpha-2,3-sialyltransferase 1-like isoform X2 n=1 Tax=Oscarella lobularis TaxID=121494 RepID=UPI003313AEFD